MNKSVQMAWNKHNKLYAEGSKLRAKGDKLYAECDKLWAEGDIIFMDAVIKAYGNIPIKWDSDGNCILTAGKTITFKS